jgi:hypothetical protein
VQLIKSPNLIEDLKGRYLFFDTNALIGGINYPDLFVELLNELKRNGCAFLTIPQVRYEFTRGSDSLKIYEERLQYLKDLEVEVYPIDAHLKDFQELAFITHRVSKNASYTDYLLGVCLCKFPTAFLITADCKDISSDLFDRKHLVTIDTDKDLTTYGIYRASQEKLNKIADNIIKKT